MVQYTTVQSVLVLVLVLLVQSVQRYAEDAAPVECYQYGSSTVLVLARTSSTTTGTGGLVLILLCFWYYRYYWSLCRIPGSPKAGR
jgi:hypothetical protein